MAEVASQRAAAGSLRDQLGDAVAAGLAQKAEAQHLAEQLVIAEVAFSQLQNVVSESGKALSDAQARFTMVEDDLRAAASQIRALEIQVSAPFCLPPFFFFLPLDFSLDRTNRDPRHRFPS